MKSKIMWGWVWIALAATPAHAQSADKEKLDQIDRSFVCPESLPDVKAKEASLDQFIKQVTAAWPGVTVAQFTAFRMALLERHECKQTLESIRRHNQQPNPQ